eukprot:TRINITY_DN70504_c0_g1_i1.p2 TRINITY_DN70504_c0_g1~~TRINITY_DN70504_c0_g1_i1.p2  ORF type:complete len:490 (+),score=173.67 TRINITY_DN70504_c0_g1_i1:100-1470(+)
MAAEVGWEEEALCCVCMELYADPVMLDCGHNVCMDCARKVYSFRVEAALEDGDESEAPPLCCPQCRAATPLPPAGVDGLKRNFGLRNVVDRLKEDKKARANPRCGNCEDEHAEFDCAECNFALCRACKEGQHSKGGYKRHTIHPLGSVARIRPKMCGQHNKELDLFDTQDDCLICIYCLQLGKHKHHLDAVVPLSDAVEKAKEQLSEAMGKAEERAQGLSVSAERMLQYVPCVEARLGELEGEVRAHFETARAALQKREAELLGGLAAIRARRVQGVGAQAERVAELQRHISELVGNCKRVVESSHHAELLRVRNMMLGRLDTVAVQECPDGVPSNDDVVVDFNDAPLLGAVGEFGTVRETGRPIPLPPAGGPGAPPAVPAPPAKGGLRISVAPGKNAPAARTEGRSNIKLDIDFGEGKARGSVAPRRGSGCSPDGKRRRKSAGAVPEELKFSLRI